LPVRHNRCAVHLDPWTSFVLRVEDWLVSLGMSEYAQRFADNDIDASVLRDLTDQDLKELGVSLGHRLKMMRAIAEMTAASSVDNAERRQLAVMFCDLVGSTSLSTRLDLEDLRKIISAYQHCSGEVITKNGGFVGRYLGDGILAYFGYPQAHEDDAENAVRASLDLIAAVAKLSASDGTALQVRVGIATGLVLVGDLIDQGVAREKTVVGETPNLAARLQALAEPDTVVIDSTTRRLLGGLFEYRALGSVSIKGFADPIPAWQVTGASAIASRFEALRGTVTPLVDREEELELLMRRWQQAKAGDGSVVMISGEPGIGKSRIVETVLERLSAEPHARLRSAYLTVKTAHYTRPLASSSTQPDFGVMTRLSNGSTKWRRCSLRALTMSSASLHCSRNCYRSRRSDATRRWISPRQNSSRRRCRPVWRRSKDWPRANPC
jgi:class 3 adenylate cyclase